MRTITRLFLAALLSFVPAAALFAQTAVESARTHLIDHLQKNPEITAAAFRDILGASRKFAIALLDYFDHSGVTTRVGDARKLRIKS